MFARSVEAVAPSRMGRGFRWLLGTEWSNQLGDGISLAAGPLLIASQTRSPSLVAMATLLQRAPWFLFGLYAGWIADRADRRLLVVIANTARVGVLFGLSAVIATGQVNVALVLVAMFLIGTAETFADSAGNTLLPMLVESKDIGLANARVTFGRRALNDLIGPPLGAGLFVIGLAAPFVMQGLLVALAAVMVSRIQVGRPADIKPTKGVRADVAEGMRWLWGNPPMRTLMLTIFLFNLTFGAAWPMLVLYADQQLGLDELGFGFLLSASAVGGLLGAAGFGWLERRFSLGMLMRVALLYETVFHLGLALSSVPVVSAGLLFLFGIEMSVWGTIANTIRQRSVPEHLLGRVSSVYLLGLFGGIVVGNALGAVIAGLWGVLAPFWFAFVGSAAMLIIIWRELPQVAYAEELGRQLR